AMFRNGDRFIADAHPPRAFYDEIKFLSLRMFVKGVRALRWEFPQGRAENFAPPSLEKIRVRNLHQVRRPPRELLRLNQKVTVDRFHLRPFAKSQSLQSGKKKE